MDERLETASLEEVTLRVLRTENAIELERSGVTSQWIAQMQSGVLIGARLDVERVALAFLDLMRRERPNSHDDGELASWRRFRMRRERLCRQGRRHDGTVFGGAIFGRAERERWRRGALLRSVVMAFCRRRARLGSAAAVDSGLSRRSHCLLWRAFDHANDCRSAELRGRSIACSAQLRLTFRTSSQVVRGCRLVAIARDACVGELGSWEELSRRLSSAWLGRIHCG